MRDPYVICYIQGRLESFEGDVDVEKLIEKISSGAPVRETTLDFARKALQPEMDSASKMQWLQDHLDDVKDLGGDTEKAWRAFCQGRIDGLAWQLEESTVYELEEEWEEGDEGEDDGEDEEAESDDQEDEDDDA